MEADFTHLVKTFLHKNGFYDVRFFDIELKSHPDYPALSALSDTFDKLGIPHLISKLSTSNADQLKGVFLAHLQKEDRPEIFLIEKTSENIMVTDQENKKSSISLSQFLLLWTGITILVESKPRRFVFFIRKYAPSIFFALLILLIYLNTQSTGATFYLLLSIIGFGLSILVLKVDLGQSSDVVNKLCGQGTKMNCNSIVHSKPSRLMNGKIKLTDLIIIYFAYVILFQMLFPNFVILGILSLLSLPFVLYSLWHQYRLNQWCTLCLLIDLILVIQFALLFFHPNLGIPTLKVLLSAILLGVLVILSWTLIKPIIAKWIQFRSVLFDLLSIKKDWKILSYYFIQSSFKKLPQSYQKFPLIQSDHGQWNLDLILQPSCPNCTTALEKIIGIQENYRCFKNIRLMIKPEKNTESDDWDSIISFIYFLNETNDLHDWLNGLKNHKSTNTGSKITPGENREDWIVALTHISIWCQDNDLNKSPLILLNQKPLPYHYSPADFEFWISKSVQVSG